jgi:glycosyltransferase involved in cell wall biosynthesis
VLIFIPVHNEEYTIAEVVNKTWQFCNFDLLIIDDGSSDSTPRILRKLDVEVLKHPTRLGLGIMSGLEVGYAFGYKYVIKIDGDYQHNPQDIPRLYEHATKTGADIVIGSRHLIDFNSRILSIVGSGMWFCSKLVSLLSRKQITDTTSGFKIWTRSACEVAIRAFKEGKLKEGSTYHVEELIIAARKKLKVEEICVVMHPREYGDTKSYSRKKLIMFPLNLIKSTVRALF